MICKWVKVKDEDWGDVYLTDCGETFILEEGTPEDNKIRYCCYCGKPLKNPETPSAGKKRRWWNW